MFAGCKLANPAQIASSTIPGRTYTVKAGDTLYAIARKHGTSIAVLVARNNIPKPNLIHVGKVLYLA